MAVAEVVVDGVETAAEPDVMEAESEDVMEVDVESELEVEAEPVGADGRNAVPIEGTIVLAPSVAAAGEAAVVPVTAQSVADTVTVDTTVTVTMLSVPMTTVGVTIPFVAEEDVVAAVGALNVITGAELESVDDDGVRVASVRGVKVEADVRTDEADEGA